MTQRQLVLASIRSGKGRDNAAAAKGASKP